MWISLFTADLKMAHSLLQSVGNTIKCLFLKCGGKEMNRNSFDCKLAFWQFVNYQDK